MTKIAVIGNWHLAFVTAAGLAELGHEVVLVNPDVERPWKEFPSLDVHEPGLIESIQRSIGAHRLSHANIEPGSSGDNTSGNPWSSVDAAVIWLAIDTPLRTDGSPDVAPLVATLRAATRGPCGRCGRLTSGIECHQCAPTFEPRASLLIISSQVPVGFCQAYERESNIPVACVPENYQLGKAMGWWNAFSFERLVIGATAETTREAVRSLFVAAHHTDEWNAAKLQNLVLCDLPTAEMIKHATNAFLATSISFANEMAKVGECYGADNQLVAKALKMDSRIGPKAYVRPGLGFSGGTLARDLMAITRVPAPLLEAVLDVNDSVFDTVAQNIVDLEPTDVCILGYTYKADTNTLRDSPARAIVRALRQKNGHLSCAGFDPRWADKDLREIEREIGSDFFNHGAWPRKGDMGNTLYVVVTPLPVFKMLNWNGYTPGLVYDLCDGADQKAVLAAGLSYKAIWQKKIEREADGMAARS